MTNDLRVVEQKVVNFNGAKLIGVKGNDDKVYVGMKWVVTGIGFNDRKGRAEVTKASEDEVIRLGMNKIKLDTGFGIKEVYCLDIDFLPLWLAKISITPTIKREQPEVADKMVQYQLKAKDVLAEAFLGKEPPMCIEDTLIQQLQVMKEMRLNQERMEQKQIEQEKELNNIKDVLCFTPKKWRDWVNEQFNKICAIKRNYRDKKNYSYDELNKRAGINLWLRVENMKKRMKKNGATKTAIKNTGALDVIESDKKLKEIYSMIVKELVLKNS